jgi:hypothetical protein
LPFGSYPVTPCGTALCAHGAFAAPSLC